MQQVPIIKKEYEYSQEANTVKREKGLQKSPNSQKLAYAVGVYGGCVNCTHFAVNEHGSLRGFTGALTWAIVEG